MRVITAVEEYVTQQGDITCFLAGGITNCWEWQNAVIDELNKMEDTEHLVLFNPRRANFPIDDPNASQEQIEWEYNQLHKADIFSMYFTAGESTQPICMYELGVHVTRAELDDKPRTVVVSVEKGYVREQDVVIQTKLALGEGIVNIDANAQSHAQLIYSDYKEILESANEVESGDEFDLENEVEW